MSSVTSNNLAWFSTHGFVCVSVLADRECERHPSIPLVACGQSSKPPAPTGSAFHQLTTATHHHWPYWLAVSHAVNTRSSLCCWCRIELYKPPYTLGPRPTWASVPTQIEFGSTFTVTLAANTSVADIVAVVLADPGTTTHALTMSTRNMQLAFTPAGGQDLVVTAPANIYVVQPGFYQLFAVSQDDSYSVGSWFRLKGPWGSRPFSLPAPAQFEVIASSQFEIEPGELSRCLKLLL